MRMRSTIVSTVIGTILLSWILMPGSTAIAQEKMRYSCSAQVFEAFEKERLDAFTRETGIEVDLFVASSSSSVNRLMYGYSDIASTAQGLRYPEKESGYLETPFCKAPLAIIVNEACPLSNLSEAQLKGVFSGDLDNWKQVGGPDQPVIVVMPAKNTAAYQNMERMIMKRKSVKYDLMTYKSTMVIEAVKRFPGSISFAALGALANVKGVKTIRIDGMSPKDGTYPFYQIFSFVTKGEPFGLARAFVGFAFTAEGKAIIEKRGMIPISR